MPTYDAAGAECLVYTYKDGLLSRMAHDLLIRVQRFSIEVADDRRSVTAELDASSLTVVDAVEGERPTGALSSDDKRKIDETIVADVLHARRYPKIRYRSSSVEPDGSGWVIAGELEVHGHTRPQRLSARREGERLVVDVRLHQPDFGIKPYRAALGALRLKPDVRVCISVPVPMS